MLILNTDDKAFAAGVSKAKATPPLHQMLLSTKSTLNTEPCADDGGCGGCGYGGDGGGGDL